MKAAGALIAKTRSSSAILTLVGVFVLSPGQLAASPSDEAAGSRELALALLQEHISRPERLVHLVAVEAIMQELARETGGNPMDWGLAGLLHDIDRAQTDDEPAQHGIVGARLLTEQGFSPDVAHAVEAHDDRAGVKRTQPIDHALNCADRVYWAIHSSGLRFPSPEAEAATAASVVAALEQQGVTGRIDAALRTECEELGLTLDEVMRLSLHAMNEPAESEQSEGAADDLR